jgi:hypothetical protein
MIDWLPDRRLYGLAPAARFADAGRARGDCGAGHEPGSSSPLDPRPPWTPRGPAGASSLIQFEAAALATSFDVMSKVIMKPFVPLNSKALGPTR